MKTGGVYDPYESVNRSIHEFNKDIDTAFFGPTSKGYTKIVPDPIEDSFVYFSKNVSMPRVAMNALLQGDLRTFGIALGRFTINTTVGFAGLADPATDFKLPQVDADFGQTLHVWGFEEGAYVELPFLGPSNVRDTVGFVGDFGLNPLEYVVANPIQNVGVYSKILEWMSDRGRFSDTVESILYESADSYAQTRLLYTQNRRFELGAGMDDAVDPYGDPYADPYSDPYSDPYADPYSDLSEDPYAE
ncbi:MAG TPA: VacJ lipoprotein [Rhodobacteraceae bacterium]|jgi:phospholipid-binding lipoprotein MlaA|nr:VacJ lipoprotein [Paracoccaceae bacterium]